jgi:hypothetical protein
MGKGLLQGVRQGNEGEKKKKKSGGSLGFREVGRSSS